MGALARPAKAGRYLVVAALLAAPGVAEAQTAWRDHARVSINFGVQPSSRTFTGTTATPLFAENATFTTSYSTSGGAMFDGGVLVRVARHVGLGVAVSSFSKSETAGIAGTLPYPFAFNMLRDISGVSGTLNRSEVGVHIQAAYVISSKRMDVAIAGGPSFFNVRQDLVADVTYGYLYPFDTATFSSATVAKATSTPVGFNAGVDVGIKVSKHVGVGGLLRFAKASVTFSLPNTASGISTDVGGLQAGGGVRFFF